MKKPITMVLALLTYASVAQYNKTYDVNGNGDYLVPSFVITTEKAESISLSIAYDAPSVPRTDYYIITKHDCTGKTMYNNRIYTNNSTTDGFTNVEALVETRDGGMLIAGYYYKDEKHIEEPFLTKVDGGGNVIWTQLYLVNREPIYNAAMNKISLCRVYDDEKENYFIVASCDADRMGSSTTDVATNVIKVDDSGNMMWAHKYYSSPDYKILREYPGDIDFAPEYHTYMITGHRYATDGNTKEYSMYFLSIDRNGAIMQPFRTAVSKSVPIDQDMVYDPRFRQYSVVFTHEKDGYVPGTSSVIGYLTIDPNMNIGNTKYLWHKEGVSHNGRSITLCSDDKHLTLGSGIYDQDMDVFNTAWQKVDAAGDPFSKFIRYNIKDQTFFGHHQMTYNCDTQREAYVLVSEQNTDLRVIRTDENGMACGSREYEPRVDKYDPKITDYRAFYERTGEYVRYDSKESMLKPPVRECKEDADSYRTALATGISQVNADGNVMLMYPSVISLSDAKLTVENNSDASVKMEMYNISGQLILSNSQIVTGKSEVALNANGNLSQGVYLLKVYDAKGTIATTTKLLITK